MSTFVLIHGAYHGGWCWQRLAPHLASAGHRVVTPDLPGRGPDAAPPGELGLADYVDSVCAVLDRQPEPAVLVGHSMAGAVITQAAEQRPQRIARLVYLTAYLLADGQAILDLSKLDGDSLTAANRVVSADGLTLTTREAVLNEAFYGDCTPTDQQWARARLVPEVRAVSTAPVRTSAANFGRVPRAYVECTADRAISIASQRRMTQALPCDPVITMDTGHSPFLCAPEALAGHLLALAQA